MYYAICLVLNDNRILVLKREKKKRLESDGLILFSFLYKSEKKHFSFDLKSIMY